jgi:hypothetical protein
MGVPKWERTSKVLNVRSIFGVVFTKWGATINTYAIRVRLFSFTDFRPFSPFYFDFPTKTEVFCRIFSVYFRYPPVRTS